jgi:hypothetical protein
MNPPTVQCERDGDGDFRFWCPFCRAEHVHGAAGGTGHRIAHCHE